MVNSPLVYVIILNYNGMRYLDACLSSLERQTYPNYKIVVFDNASTDGSADFIKKYFSNIVLIQSETNHGFAKGNNIAIKYVLSQKADYAFLLNNDTTMERNLLEKLVSTFESDSSVGIVGPKIFDLNHSGYLQESGMAADRFGYPLSVKSIAPYDEFKVFFVSGCAMMIKSEILGEIGLFDEEYFMFAEDFDLCWRVRLAGYKIKVNEEARIYHASGGSIAGGAIKESSYTTNVTRVFLREKNTIRTLIKNYNSINMIKTVSLYVLLLLMESAMWLFLLRPETSRNILKAIYWNIESLPSSLKLRALVQNKRKVNDRDIIERMVNGYGKSYVFKLIGLPRFVLS